MMVDVSRAHSAIVENLVRTLLTRLDPDQWHVAIEAFGLDLLDSVRYPDVLVEPRNTAWAERRARDPVLAVEVLSPSSTKTDMIQKPREYFTLASLDTYLVLSQEEPIAWVWHRAADGSVSAIPEEIVGRVASVAVPGLGLELPMAELYRGLPDAG